MKRVGLEITVLAALLGGAPSCTNKSLSANPAPLRSNEETPEDDLAAMIRREAITTIKNGKFFHETEDSYHFTYEGKSVTLRYGDVDGHNSEVLEINISSSTHRNLTLRQPYCTQHGDVQLTYEERTALFSDLVGAVYDRTEKVDTELRDHYSRLLHHYKCVLERAIEESIIAKKVEDSGTTSYQFTFRPVYPSGSDTATARLSDTTDEHGIREIVIEDPTPYGIPTFGFRLDEKSKIVAILMTNTSRWIDYRNGSIPNIEEGAKTLIPLLDKYLSMQVQ